MLCWVLAQAEPSTGMQQRAKGVALSTRACKQVVCAQPDLAFT